MNKDKEKIALYLAHRNLNKAEDFKVYISVIRSEIKRIEKLIQVTAFSDKENEQLYAEELKAFLHVEHIYNKLIRSGEIAYEKTKED